MRQSTESLRHRRFRASTFVAAMGLAMVVVLTACEGVKSSDDQAEISKAAAGFNGEWKTDLLKFETDQCAFRLVATSDATVLTLNALVVACASGGVEGLYIPMTLAVAPRSDFADDVLNSLGAPQAAQVLTLASETGSVSARGWIDTSNPAGRVFSVKLQTWDNALFNQLQVKGVLRPNGSIELSGLKLRDGWSVTDTLVLRKEAVGGGDFLSGRMPWNRLALPPGAILSTGPENQNFLFCVDKKNPNVLALVDLKSRRYVLSGGSIGEIGFIDRSAENRVVMWGSNYGSVVAKSDMLTYRVSVTGVGGRTQSFNIVMTPEGFGFLSTGNDYSRSYCRAVQNDVFSGYYGWNP